MGTDIYGGIEFRHPSHGEDFYDGEPWVKALDLWPLLAGGGPAGAYPELAFLFGVRDTYGFAPLAAGRGLPDDVSAELREELSPAIASGELVASWVAWSELAGLDMDGPFGPFVALVDGGEGAVHLLTLVRDGWTPDDLAHCDPPPDLAERAADGPVVWTRGAVTYTFTPITLGSVLGPGTPWGHVLAVMRALADRYGPDEVRLVAAFD